MEGTIPSVMMIQAQTNPNEIALVLGSISLIDGFDLIVIFCILHFIPP